MYDRHPELSKILNLKISYFKNIYRCVHIQTTEPTGGKSFHVLTLECIFNQNKNFIKKLLNEFKNV